MGTVKMHQRKVEYTEKVAQKFTREPDWSIVLLASTLCMGCHDNVSGNKCRLGLFLYIAAPFDAIHVFKTTCPQKHSFVTHTL